MLINGFGYYREVNMFNKIQLYYRLLLVTVLLVSVTTMSANAEPYPFDNPVVTHLYTADAAPHVMPDGRVWMVTSIDSEQGGGYSTMHAYHLFSSANMTDWVDHGEVFHLNDIHPNEDPSWQKLRELPDWPCLRQAAP